jgi:hypothetical protein
MVACIMHQRMCLPECFNALQEALLLPLQSEGLAVLAASGCGSQQCLERPAINTGHSIRFASGLH